MRRSGNEIFCFERRYLGEQDAMHHAHVALIQPPEGVAMALLRKLHQSSVGIGASDRSLARSRQLRVRQVEAAGHVALMSPRHNAT
jgi:hypothetical protein